MLVNIVQKITHTSGKCPKQRKPQFQKYPDSSILPSENEAPQQQWPNKNQGLMQTLKSRQPHLSNI
jgi:hypothetical protein